MNEQNENKRSRLEKSLQPPIFIVGYMHSGTTLLIDIIKSHSSVFSGQGESKYFMHLPMIRHTFPNIEDDRALQKFVSYIVSGVEDGFGLINRKDDGEFGFENKLNLENLPEEAKKNRNYESMFAFVCDHLARAAGKKRWVEKTPTHIFHVDEIVRSVPDALFVEIVRDPRDVLASKKKRKQSVWNSERYRPADRQKKTLGKSIRFALGFSFVEIRRSRRTKRPQKIR